MMRHSIVTAMLVLASPLIATNAARAQYLADRLVPPHQINLPPIPLVNQPVEARQFGAEKVRDHLWALPFGAFPGSSVLVATESGPVLWNRPLLDSPGLASETDPTRPAFPLQPTAPRAFARGPDPEAPPALARFSLVTEPAVVASDDPSGQSAFALLTAGVPLASPEPIPLMRLSIPDPFEHIRVIRPTIALADADDPATAQDRPPLMKLPLVEPPQ